MTTTKYQFVVGALGSIAVIAGTGIHVIDRAMSTAPLAIAAPASQPAFYAKIEQIKIGDDSPARVRELLGEPEKYTWGNKALDAAHLPEVYYMAYPGGVGVIVARGVVSETRFNAPGYKYLGKIGVGSTLAEVTDAIGKPTKTVTGGPLEFVDGVLYVDFDGHKGMSYYSRADKAVRMFFRDGRVIEMSRGTSEMRPAKG
jgi:hypothetical protein